MHTGYLLRLRSGQPPGALSIMAMPLTHQNLRILNSCRRGTAVQVPEGVTAQAVQQSGVSNYIREHHANADISSWEIITQGFGTDNMTHDGASSMDLRSTDVGSERTRGPPFTDDDESDEHE